MSRQNFQDRWASGGARTDPGDVKIALGWEAEKPPYQFENWRANRVDEMLAHLEEQGIADWDAATPYLNGGLAIGSNRVLYRAAQANQGNDPTTDNGTNWAALVPIATDTQAGIIEVATQVETNDGLDGSRAVTPLTLANKIATEAIAGVLRVATAGEAAALSVDNRIVTPAKLGLLIASSVQRGLVALASHAEVVAGTEQTKAVSPHALASGSSIGATGYEVRPGGRIAQWGTANIPASPADITLPLTFPNAIHGAVLGGPTLAQGTWDAGVEVIDTSTIRISTAHLDQDIYWEAWGN